MAASVYLGIDGGGTSTRAVALDASGEVAFRGKGGPCNLSSPGLEAALDALAACAEGCPPPVAVAAALAGATDEAKRDAARARLAGLFPAAQVEVVADWEALPFAAGEGTAAVVLAGTGSAVVSLRDGRPFATGGGGPMMGDEGSAFDVVRRWAAALLAAGRPASATLAGELGRLFGTSSLREVCGRWAQPGFVPALASLARMVAADGTPEASRAVNSAMDALAHQVHLHLDAAGQVGGPTPIELAGGLWDAHPAFAERLVSALSVTGEAPVHRQYRVRPLAAPPELGAARLAIGLDNGN